MSDNNNQIDQIDDGKKQADKSRVICDFSDKMGNVGPIHYICLFFWVGWFLLLPLILALLPILYFYARTAFTCLMAIIILSAVYPIERRLQPKWGYAFGAFCMKIGCEYFGLKVIQDDPDALRTAGPVVMALEPHDILPFGLFSFSDDLGFFPGQKMLGCLASICFQAPIMLHVYTWASATSVDKKNLHKMLRRGVSPIICPGGVLEVTFVENNDDYVLYLKSRFGILKLAMKYGYPIVPTFAFGQRKTYDFYVPKSKFIHKIGRKFGFLPLWFRGLWGIPLGPPKSTQITVVVGAPVPMPKTDNPTKEQLADAQARFFAGIEHIFEKYKAECNQPNSKLKII